MRSVPDRARVVPALLILALAAGACGQAAEETSETAADSPTSVKANGAPAPVDPAPETRSEAEQAFLDDLAEFGLPTGMSAETTVEVGIGICENTAEGVDTETILDQIRPLSSAIATQSSDQDTDRVGRTIVEASRAHLCD
ncbi:DUF732 domain-containing protein [Dietzia aurantiaca]|uniref:DUF732 domain-containing protein n=1 Tax=Dietzia aurantiaca TaxID=983873 RepID=A0ABV9PSM8_9ACTN